MGRSRIQGPRCSVGAKAQRHVGSRHVPVSTHRAASRAGASPDHNLVRSIIGQLANDEDKLRAAVREVIGSGMSDECAIQAVRLIVSGFTIAHAAREIGQAPSTVAGWWERFRLKVIRQKASRD